MKYIYPILEKKENLEQHHDVLKEEFEELLEALKEKEPFHIVEEFNDCVQALVGLADELEHRGINMHMGNLLHQKKLVNRGWNFKGHIEVKEFR